MKAIIVLQSWTYSGDFSTQGLFQIQSAGYQVNLLIRLFLKSIILKSSLDTGQHCLGEQYEMLDTQ